MAVYFSADDVFQIAMDMEENGARFYSRAAERAKEEHARKLLLDLAAMENWHEEVFAKMRAELPTAEEAETEMFTDPSGKDVSILKLMAEGIVFDAKADPSERLTGKETMEEILAIAVGLEKDSIVFYMGMKNIVSRKWFF